MQALAVLHSLTMWAQPNAFDTLTINSSNNTILGGNAASMSINTTWRWRLQYTDLTRRRHDDYLNDSTNALNGTVNGSYALTTLPAQRADTLAGVIGRQHTTDFTHTQHGRNRHP